MIEEQEHIEEQEDSRDWPLENRPQDPYCDGLEFSIEPCDAGRPFPRAIEVVDVQDRFCRYIAAHTTIVNATDKQMALQFTTLEHGGDYPDMMPQAIQARDWAGNVCRYVAVNPRLYCWILP